MDLWGRHSYPSLLLLNYKKEQTSQLNVVFLTPYSHSATPLLHRHYPTTYSHVLVVGHAEINIIYPSLPPGACSLGFGFSSHSDMTPTSQSVPLGLLCTFLLLCWSSQYWRVSGLFEVALSSLTTLLSFGSLYANNFQNCISGFNNFSKLKLQISNCQHIISTRTLIGTSNLAWPE